MSKTGSLFHYAFNTEPFSCFRAFGAIVLATSFISQFGGCASLSASKCACDNSIAATEIASRTLVLMTDFGLADGAVSAMKGVARDTAPDVTVSDLTHEIPPYNIWEAAYRLNQTYRYWPKGTVFVSVIDPGVGSERKSIAMKTKSGHVFVGPDNGLFTFIADQAGVEAIAVIDESKQRLKGSEESYTFHGRDLYVYVGARLAGGLIQLRDLGAATDRWIKLPYQKAEFIAGEEKSGDVIRGTIPVLDPNYGNVWTNIPKTLFDASFNTSSTGRTGGANAGSRKFRVRIAKIGFDQILPLEATFAGVPKGKPLLYFNSLMNLSIALNQGDFAKVHNVKSGPEWTISVSPR